MNLPFFLRESGADFLYVTALKSGNGSRVTTAFLSQNMRSSQIAYCYTYRKAYAEGGTAMPPKDYACDYGVARAV